MTQQDKLSFASLYVGSGVEVEYECLNGFKIITKTGLVVGVERHPSEIDEGWFIIKDNHSDKGVVWKSYSECKLKLKPLSAISEEEYGILYDTLSKIDLLKEYCFPYTGFKQYLDVWINHATFPAVLSDQLRRWGYLTGYLQYRPQDIIDSGIVELSAI